MANPDDPLNSDSVLDLRLTVEAALDPRSKEFREAIKLTPATLAHYNTSGRWTPAEHLLYISSILAHELALGDARIIIEEPPRHGKSELASVHTPIWMLERFPWAHVVLTTYAADLASGFGRRVRDTFLQNERQVLDTRIRDDVQQTAHFLTSEGGSMTSVGIGGPITGRGAHLLVVDDYIKNWVEASSALMQQSIWDWFTTTAYTRLEPGGSVIILATRWVLNDLIGRLKKADKDHMWTVIRLPAIAQKNDPLNREVGDPLWPERYPLDTIQKIRSVVGEFVFQAMYQQDPKPAADTTADISQFREIPIVEHPHLYRWVRSWDLAATPDRKADYTVGSLIGTNGRPGASTARTVIADMVRGQWGPADVEETLRTTAEADSPSVPIVIEQEPGSSGKMFAQHLATNVLRGFRVTITPPGSANKWIRAQPYIAAVSHGRIDLLRAKWNQAHKDELKEFTGDGSGHDDTVDSVAQGFNHLHLTKVASPTWGRNLTATSQSTNPQDKANSEPATRSGRVITGVVFGRRVF